MKQWETSRGSFNTSRQHVFTNCSILHFYSQIRSLSEMSDMFFCLVIDLCKPIEIQPEKLNILHLVGGALIAVILILLTTNIVCLYKCLKGNTLTHTHTHNTSRITQIISRLLKKLQNVSFFGVSFPCILSDMKEQNKTFFTHC